MKDLDSFDSKESPIFKPKITSRPSLFATSALNPKENLNNSTMYNLQKVFFDEGEGIEALITTPYEKVLKILEKVKNNLENERSSKDTVGEIAWVIKRIRANDYYNFDFNDQTVIDFEKYCDQSHEVKTFFDILNENSEGNQRRKRKFGTTNFNNEKEKAKFVAELKIKTSKLKEIKQNKSMMTVDHSDLHQSRVDMSFLKKGFIDLENIFSQDFNIFEAESEVGEEHIFPVLGKSILKALNLNSVINENNLDEFLVTAGKGYKKNPYHRALHGVDVMHTVSMFIVHTNLTEELYLNSLDLVSFVISALLHDIGHPGLNNNFQINSQSELAMIYNDKSVLENFHISEASKLLRRPNCNILSNLTPSEYKIFRKRLIESILYTDMVFHAKCQTIMKNKVDEAKKNKTKIVAKESDNLFDQQQEILSYLVHTADISHSSKTFEISYKWTMSLFEEFWNQGDIEKHKGLPISFLCDRTTADIPKGQLGFIRGLIVPSFETLVDFLPELDYLLRNIEDNLIQWNDLIGKNREENFIDKINNLKEKLNNDKKSIFNQIDEVESKNQGNIFDFSVNKSGGDAESVIDFSRFDLGRVESEKKEDNEIEKNINVDNTH